MAIDDYLFSLFSPIVHVTYARNQNFVRDRNVLIILHNNNNLKGCTYRPDTI